MSPPPPQKCLKCDRPAQEFVNIDAGMRVLLQNAGHGQQPDKVCSRCYNDLTAQASHGVKLKLEKQAKENNRHMIWKSRVNLIRSARQMMQQKSYSDAAVNYEKYLRIVEISYDLKPGQLSPQVFGNSARSKELTIIASTYWDLFRIYDGLPQHRDRMKHAGNKLTEFVPHSPIYSHIIKQAQSFVKTSKNPDLAKDFLKKSKVSGGRCFIATAAFDDADHPVVIDLRRFRDEVLLNHPSGELFVSSYYKVSPYLANLITRSGFLCCCTRCALRLIHACLKKVFLSQN